MNEFSGFAISWCDGTLEGFWLTFQGIRYSPTSFRKTYKVTPDRYFMLGSMTTPSSSRAFEMVNVARMEARLIHILDSAICDPGQILEYSSA
jgi:hypothetical protein